MDIGKESISHLKHLRLSRHLHARIPKVARDFVPALTFLPTRRVSPSQPTLQATPQTNNQQLATTERSSASKIPHLRPPQTTFHTHVSSNNGPPPDPARPATAPILLPAPHCARFGKSRSAKGRKCRCRRGRPD